MPADIIQATSLVTKPPLIRRAIKTIFDFGAATEQAAGFNPETLGMPDRVQGIFVDNAANSQGVQINFDGNISQSFFAAANSQTYIPIMFSKDENISVRCVSSGGVKVAIYFLNFEPPANSFSTVAPGAIVGAVTVQGTVFAQAPIANYSSYSGSIAVGGTSQLLRAANPLRKGLLIQNPATATGQGIAQTESLFINFLGAATVDLGTSIEIVAGGYFSFNGIPVSGQAVQINAATTGHRFLAWEQ